VHQKSVFFHMPFLFFFVHKKKSPFISTESKQRTSREERASMFTAAPWDLHGLSEGMAVL